MSFSSQAETAAKDDPGNPLVEVRSAGSMSRGIFATKDLPPGTQILSEKPLIIVSGTPKQATLAENIAAFCEAALKTSRSSRNLKLMETLSSDNICEYDPQTAKAIYNWFIANEPGHFTLPHQDVRGVFYHYGLINHACSPNAYAYYDSLKQQHQVHLIRAVKAGDQIFVSYTRFQALPRAERHAELRQQGHTFVCECILCTSPEAEVVMRRIFASYVSLSNFLVRERMLAGRINASFPTTDDDKEALTIAEELLDLFRHPSIDMFGPDLKVTLHVCSLISRKLGYIRTTASYARQEPALQARVWGFEAENYLHDNDAAPWLHMIEEELSRMEASDH